MDHIPKEFDRGKLDSGADHMAGCPKLYWQTRGSWGDRLTELMRDRFGVAVQHISDITYDEEVSYRRGYNEATSAYIDEKFGAGTYQAVLDRRLSCKKLPSVLGAKEGRSGLTPPCINSLIPGRLRSVNASRLDSRPP